MLTFWNIKSNKLDNLAINPNEEKIIFVSDTERLYVDFNGIRTEYRNIIYVQDINNIPIKDGNKNSIYFEIPTKRLYYYIDGEYFLLNPEQEGYTFIGRFIPSVETTITTSILDTFVQNMKGRNSQINDLIIDQNGNKWIKIENLGTQNDWICISNNKLASYEAMGLVKIKQNSGLKIENGILSLNLLDSNRLPGQIVTLNDGGKIDSDIVEIEWESL